MIAPDSPTPSAVTTLRGPIPVSVLAAGQAMVMGASPLQIFPKEKGQVEGIRRWLRSEPIPPAAGARP